MIDFLTFLLWMRRYTNCNAINRPNLNPLIMLALPFSILVLPATMLENVRSTALNPYKVDHFPSFLLVLLLSSFLGE